MSDVYIQSLNRALNEFVKNIKEIDEPNAVLGYIANKSVKDSYKANLVDYYRRYCDFKGIEFHKPRYSRAHALPYVATKEQLGTIMSHANTKYSLIYSIMRDTGLRPIEVSNLRAEDINLENGTMRVDTAKHGNPRIVKVTVSTLNMLKIYLDKHEQLSFPDSNVISNTYARLRKSIAKKLQKPELMKIRLYDFRHYYATNLYHDTHDLLLVKERLGHRNIENTVIYTHLVNVEEDGKYWSATAKTVDEARALIEQGFEYVTEIDEVKLFRKRK